MKGNQIFNLIPPVLPKQFVTTDFCDTIICANEFAANFQGLSTERNKVSLDAYYLKVDNKEELYENKGWIILSVKPGKFLMRNANAEPGKLCNVYECNYDSWTIKVVSAEQEYFQPKQGIETLFEDLVFSRYGGGTLTTEFLEKLSNQCTSLKDSTSNMLKDWQEYVRYEKNTIDLLHRCKINLQVKRGKDVFVYFLRDSRFQDEFDMFENENIEIDLKKFNKALADRTLEFLGKGALGRPYKILDVSNRDLDEPVIKPLITNGKAIGVRLKRNEISSCDRLIYTFQDGEDIECSLTDKGKAAQLERFEKCLKRLIDCNTRNDIRVLRWLMEYANNCGRALDKQYWEEITEYKNNNLNQEQKEAVQLILNTTDIGFIMGPPGTGKTSVIAEAIYQLAKRGKKILLSSQSNDAIDNALDRLKANPDVRAVRLVSREDYPDKTFDRRYFAWNMVSSLDEDIEKALEEVNAFLNKYDNAPQELPVNNEDAPFMRYVCNLVYSNYAKDKTAFVQRLRQDYPYWNGAPFHKFLAKTINIICGRAADKFIRNEEYITKLYWIACKLQNYPTVEGDWLYEGVRTIQAWRKMLFTPTADAKTIERQKKIRDSFTSIHEAMNNVGFDAESDADTFERSYNVDYYGKLIRTANVFGITCNANAEKLLAELVKSSVDYDYVIIDEVSKATTLELLTPMLKAPKCILIGDHHQLPPVFLADDDIKANEELCYKYEDLITNTFFKNYFDAAPESCKCVLRKQYRMHSEIADVAVANFYKASKDKVILENGLTKEAEGKLKVHDITIESGVGRKLVVPDHHLYWMDSTPYDTDGELSKDRNLYEDRKDTTSCANEYEIQGILKLLEKLEVSQAAQGTDKKLSIGIISFYSLQNKLLRKSVDKIREKLPHLDIDVNTVDRFQGQEREVIIVSLVRSKMGQINSGNEFFRKYERINVAFSRAQKLLFIVGSERFCKVQSVPVDYISLTGTEVDSDELSAEEMIYRDIIAKLKENECFFNIKELEE